MHFRAWERRTMVKKTDVCKNSFLMGVQRWDMYFAFTYWHVDLGYPERWHRARARIKTERSIVHCSAYRVYRACLPFSPITLSIHKHLVIDAVAKVLHCLDDVLQVEIRVEIVDVNTDSTTTCNITLGTSDSGAAGFPRAHRGLSLVTPQATGWQAAAGTRSIVTLTGILAVGAWSFVDTNSCTLARNLVVAPAHVEKAPDAFVQRASDLHVSPLKHFGQQVIDLDHPLRDLALVGGGLEGIERFCAVVAPLEGVGAHVEFMSLLSDGRGVCCDVQGQIVHLEAVRYEVERESGGFGAIETAVAQQTAAWAGRETSRWNGCVARRSTCAGRARARSCGCILVELKECIHFMSGTYGTCRALI